MRALVYTDTETLIYGEEKNLKTDKNLKDGADTFRRYTTEDV